MSYAYILSVWDNSAYDHNWVFSDRESAEEYRDALVPHLRKETNNIYSTKRNGRCLFVTIEECQLDPSLDTVSSYL